MNLWELFTIGGKRQDGRGECAAKIRYPFFCMKFFYNTARRGGEISYKCSSYRSHYHPYTVTPLSLSWKNNYILSIRTDTPHLEKMKIRSFNTFPNRLTYPSGCSLMRNFFRLKDILRILAQLKVLILVKCWNTAMPMCATARFRGTPSWSFAGCIFIPGAGLQVINISQDGSLSPNKKKLIGFGRTMGKKAKAKRKGSQLSKQHNV